MKKLLSWAMMLGLIIGVVSMFPLLGCKAAATTTETTAITEEVKEGEEILDIYAIGVDPGVDPFFATVLKGMKSAEELFPIKLNYIGLKGDELSPNSVAAKLEQAVAAKPDGIIIGFWFAEAISDICTDAIAQGISIMAYNTPDFRPEGEKIDYLGFVGMDDSITGEFLARATLAKMNNNIERTVIGLNYPGSTPIENRASGIARVMDENEIPYEKLDVTADNATCINVLGAYLTKYPETDLIFVLGPSSTEATMDMLEDQGLKGKVSVSTFDVSQETIDGIKEGTILYTVIQQPFAQGFLSVEQLYLYKKFGIIPPEETQTGPTLVDIINMDIIQKQLDITGGA